MYYVSAQGVDKRAINVHYYHHYYQTSLTNQTQSPRMNSASIRTDTFSWVFSLMFRPMGFSTRRPSVPGRRHSDSIGRHYRHGDGTEQERRARGRGDGWWPRWWTWHGAGADGPGDGGVGLDSLGPGEESGHWCGQCGPLQAALVHVSLHRAADLDWGLVHAHLIWIEDWFTHTWSGLMTGPRTPDLDWGLVHAHLIWIEDWSTHTWSGLRTSPRTPDLDW